MDVLPTCLMSSPKLTKTKTAENLDPASLKKTRGTSSEAASEIAVLSIKVDQEDSIKSWAEEIWAFLKGKEEAAVSISPLNSQTAIKLQEKLKDIGLKLRLDWWADSRVAYFRMPTRIHSRPLAEWLNNVLPGLSASIEGLGCGNQFLVNGGDEKITLEDGSHCVPDAALLIRQDKGGVNVCKHRVLIESMASQTHADGKRKAVRYLTQSNNTVHAVLLLNFKNRPTKSAPKSGPCKAVLEVWARKKSKHPAINFPYDLCGLAEDDASDDEMDEETPDDGQQGGTAPLAQVDQQQQGGQSAETPPLVSTKEATAADSSEDSWNDDTKVDIIEPLLPALTNEEPPVEMKESYLVYDETPGAVLDADMFLDAYYFIRICRMNPGKGLTWEERQIKVPLTPLRKSVEDTVAEYRSELRRIELGRPVKRKAQSGGARATLEVEGPVKKPRATSSEG
ncbi:hypothetical protein RSOLAG22IIIB_10431 [Rhizoctonia solani]|uniref:Uncharacterized protein n=1 Tax=Rhizoctonia solani TaxID=456999 RepID=A0A0K6G368_9AGAM|nr:hypothetical protein RSOLAG22IIIB_10431 [Rhizoctonia solani]